MMFGVLLAAALAAHPAPAPAAKPLPPPDQVMAIPDELREAFRREVVDDTRFPQARLEKLVEFVFDEDNLGVTYTAYSTGTVAGAYRTREVNCLSSALMIVALAREAGLEAQAQQVNRIVTWGVHGEMVMQSQHVNAIVGLGNGRRYVIDVDASDVLATEALHPIGDEQLLAYFYGNRAMELLAEGRLAEARASLDQALELSPEDASLWNNDGVLHLRAGDEAAAERGFLRAVRANPEQIGALSNLMNLYKRRGDTARAAQWQAHADKVLRDAPYYQFELGRQRELSGDIQDAIRYYRRAISLARDEHRFHFALARAYLGTGQRGKADKELSLAYEYAEGPVRERYQGKLALLRQMH